MKSVVVVVLGDVGRSPRMQYHAKMFAECSSIHRVTLVGYHGEKCIPEVENNKKIVIERFSPFDAQWAKKLNFIRAILKGITCLFQLFIKLMFLPHCDVILIQNPPCIPVLIAALIVSCFRKCNIWLDWHNIGFTMFKRGSTGSRLSRYLECKLARYCTVHFCVSNAMKRWLEKEFAINADVLYDRPSKRFSVSGPSITDRHNLLKRLGFTDANVFTPSRTGNELTKNTSHQSSGDTTIQTYADSNGNIKLRSDSSRILLSSTSWTEDEDFQILLDAIVKLDQILVRNLASIKPSLFHACRVVVVVTGKGPLKQQFLSAYAQIETTLQRVAVRTPWLEPEDYPLLVSCADVGVCLHASTSGLDLPMKVLLHPSSHIV